MGTVDCNSYHKADMSLDTTADKTTMAGIMVATSIENLRTMDYMGPNCSKTASQIADKSIMYIVTGYSSSAIDISLGFASIITIEATMHPLLFVEAIEDTVMVADIADLLYFVTILAIQALMVASMLKDLLFL